MGAGHRKMLMAAAGFPLRKVKKNHKILYPVLHLAVTLKD